MENFKCHIRGWEWGGQEGDGSKPESSSSVSHMAWEAPNLDSNRSSEANWLCDLGKGFALSELLFLPRWKTKE